MNEKVWLADRNFFTSKPYKPKQIERAWLMERDGGSRWNLFGPKYVPDGFRSPHNARMVKTGVLVEAQFTIDIVEVDLPDHADWLLVFQIHGKNSWEDDQVGQVSISVRNHTPEGGSTAGGRGLCWFLHVTGDQRWMTKGEHMRTLATNEKHFLFDLPIKGPITWTVRTVARMTDETSDDPNFAPADGETVFFYQTPDMDEPVEAFYVQGACFFPVLNEPETGQQTPAFGLYASNSIKDNCQRAYYSNISVRYSSDPFTRSMSEPVVGMEPA